MDQKDWIELKVGRIFGLKRSIFDILFRKKINNYALTLINNDNEEEKMYLLTGKYESQNLAMAIENIEPNVQTLELLFRHVIKEFDLKIDYVLICSVNSEGYYKSIVKFSSLNKNQIVEARTVDLISLGLRNKSKIYIEKELFENSKC